MIGSVYQLMIRYLIIDLSEAGSRNAHIRLSMDSLRQILFLVDNIHCIDVRKIASNPL